MIIEYFIYMGEEVLDVVKYIDCIDAGTDYCPCSLAERKECIICPRLQDSDVCDCLNWKGTCICQDFISNGYKSKRSRGFVKYNILERRMLRNDLLMLKIKVSSTLARELNNFGAYVFLKREGDIDAYSTPLSIMESDIENNIITIVVKIMGAKTKALLDSKSEILLKGPYWNGIQGQKYLKDLKDKSCLILARGVAAAPAVLAAKRLVQKGNQVYVLLDRGRGPENFAHGYFKDAGAKIEDIYFFDREGNFSGETRAIIEHLLRKWNFKVVLSAGSDEFHSRMIKFIGEKDKYVSFATVSNSVMCCGEGVCGSCEVSDRKGERIRTCKQQYDPVEVFLKEMGK